MDVLTSFYQRSSTTTAVSSCWAPEPVTTSYSDRNEFPKQQTSHKPSYLPCYVPGFSWVPLASRSSVVLVLVVDTMQESMQLYLQSRTRHCTVQNTGFIYQNMSVTADKPGTAPLKRFGCSDTRNDLQYLSSETGFGLISWNATGICSIL